MFFRTPGRQVGALILTASLLVSPLLANHRIVTAVTDSTTGSLREAIDLAAPGDTVLFNFTGKDTVYLKNNIDLAKSIVIDGAHLITGKKVIVTRRGSQNGIFIVSGGPVTLKSLVIDFGDARRGGNVWVRGAAARLVIDSSVIQRGMGGEQTDYESGGGGIYNDSGSVTITNSRFSNNTVGYAGRNGAAIYNNRGTMELNGDSLTNNYTFGPGYGGGVFIVGGSMTFSHCVFVRDSAGGSGGGIYIDTGRVSMTNCTMRLNRSGSYGGAIFNDKGDVSLNECLITQDTAAGYGGGIYNGAGTIVITGGEISNNVAKTYAPNMNQGNGNDLITIDVRSCGGGIFNMTGNVSIKNTTIKNNVSYAYISSNSSLCHVNDTAYGGGIYNETGIVVLKNSVVTGNCATATSSQPYVQSPGNYSLAIGGGLCNRGGRMAIESCEMTNNSCKRYSRYGWEFAVAVYNEKGRVSVVNSTISNDSAVDGTGGNAVDNKNGRVSLVYCTIANIQRSGGGYNYAVRCDSSCLLLNTIIVHNSGTDFYGPASNRAVHCLIGAGNRSLSDSAFTVQKIFGTATPFLARHGGPTRTISLGTSASIAVGAGFRAGLYTEDPACSQPAAKDDSIACAGYRKAAYFNGTQWIDLETDSAVSPGATVMEITVDQRGVGRGVQPSIGAFEFTTADRAEPRLPFPPSNPAIHYRLMNSTLHLSCISPRDRVCLYSLSGRRLVKAVGISRIDLSLLARQPLFVQVEREGNIVSTGKIMAPERRF